MTTIRLLIPFESLTQAITALGLEDKCKLLEMLKDQIAEAEEDIVVTPDPEVAAETDDLNLYQASDYESIEDYIDSRSRQIS